MLSRHSYIPLAIGLMIWPTMAYRFSVLELPRTSITLRGFPLPWNGDAPVGSGPPIDIFLVPACIDLALYLILCAMAWRWAFTRLRASSGVVRTSVVAVAWLYAIFSVSSMTLWLVGFGGSAKAWYDTSAYESLIAVGFNIGM